MYGSLKQHLLDVTGLGPMSLHVIIGGLVFLALLAVTRKLVLSLAILTAGQVGNELLDFADDLVDGVSLQIRAAAEDTVLTLCLPLIAVGTARIVRRRL